MLCSVAEMNVITVYRVKGKARRYHTKSETPVHEHLRKNFEGVTYFGEKLRVLMDFVPGMPFDDPLVIGATAVKREVWSQ